MTAPQGSFGGIAAPDALARQIGRFRPRLVLAQNAHDLHFREPRSLQPSVLAKAGL
jgi:hypothetical protein